MVAQARRYMVAPRPQLDPLTEGEGRRPNNDQPRRLTGRTRRNCNQPIIASSRSVRAQTSTPSFHARSWLSLRCSRPSMTTLTLTIGLRSVCNRRNRALVGDCHRPPLTTAGHVRHVFPTASSIGADSLTTVSPALDLRKVKLDDLADRFDPHSTAKVMDKHLYVPCFNHCGKLGAVVAQLQLQWPCRDAATGCHRRATHRSRTPPANRRA